MSTDNIELAERAVDGYNRLDVESVAEHATADFVWYPAMPGLVEGDGYRGRAGIERYFTEVRSTWQALRVVDAEFRDLGDAVLVLGRIEGEGRGSGVQVESEIGIVFDLRGDMAWRSRAYLAHDEALRAVGHKA